MPSTRPPIAQSLASPRAAARRLDRDDVPRAEVARQLRAGRLAVDEVASGRAGLPAALALRRLRAALADDRESAVLERTQLADDTVAPVMCTAAAGAEPQPVALDAQRVLQLERLDRRRECVRHRHVHAARSVRVRAGALSTADRLVI